MLDKYKVTLQAARKDRDDLLQKQADLFDERDLVESQIEETAQQLKELDGTIASLARLCKVEIVESLAELRLKPLTMTRHTLTEAVRMTFRINNSPLTAVMVRDQMLERGFDQTGFSNLLASVHTTLKRLAESGELLRVEVDGKTAYKLNPDYLPRMGMGLPPHQATKFERMPEPPIVIARIRK